MINAVGAAQSILVLGGTSEIGLAITAEFLEKRPPSNFGIPAERPAACCR